jgi:hypothetical protein
VGQAGQRAARGVLERATRCVSASALDVTLSATALQLRETTYFVRSRHRTILPVQARWRLPEIAVLPEAAGPNGNDKRVQASVAESTSSQDRTVRARRGVVPALLPRLMSRPVGFFGSASIFALMTSRNSYSNLNPYSRVVQPIIPSTVISSDLGVIPFLMLPSIPSSIFLG